jgi:hypothetical protein
MTPKSHVCYAKQIIDIGIYGIMMDAQNVYHSSYRKPLKKISHTNCKETPTTGNSGKVKTAG